MKKNSLRNLIVALLVFTSFGSFIYLNTVQIEKSPKNPEMKAELQEEQEEEEEIEMILPDVQMVKKVLEKSKAILPSS